MASVLKPVDALKLALDRVFEEDDDEEAGNESLASELIDELPDGVVIVTDVAFLQTVLQEALDSYSGDTDTVLPKRLRVRLQEALDLLG